MLITKNGVSHLRNRWIRWYKIRSCRPKIHRFYNEYTFSYIYIILFRVSSRKNHQKTLSLHFENKTRAIGPLNVVVCDGVLVKKRWCVNLLSFVSILSLSVVRSIPLWSVDSYQSLGGSVRAISSDARDYSVARAALIKCGWWQGRLSSDALLMKSSGADLICVVGHVSLGGVHE